MATEAARLARLGAVLATESRAAILCALMGGTAHTNGELARHLGLSASSVSEHVSVLLDAELVTTAAQGRHRYVRIADARTAELVEHLGVVASGHGGMSPPAVPAALAVARSCYRHLAGSLGVRIYDRLCERGALLHEGDALRVGCRGVDVFSALGIASDTVGALRAHGAEAAPLVRSCLDWSERRPHLAGSLGDALLSALLSKDWLRRHPTKPRALVVSAAGRQGFAETLGIEL